jgi:hypothetical protein
VWQLHVPRASSGWVKLPKCGLCGNEHCAGQSWLPNYEGADVAKLADAAMIDWFVAGV